MQYHDNMNSKHRKTLESIFAAPTPKTLLYRNVESMLLAVGCKIAEGEGSRVAFYLNGNTLNLHRPHPGKEILAYQVRETKGFLERSGVTP